MDKKRSSEIRKRVARFKRKVSASGEVKARDRDGGERALGAGETEERGWGRESEGEIKRPNVQQK